MPDATLVDPLGRTIILHDRTWYGHIIRGHPEMEPCRDQVESTITNPAQIQISRSNPACRQYYSNEDETGLSFMVIADIELALVKTAHYVKKMKGGAIEWSQPTP